MRCLFNFILEIMSLGDGGSIAIARKTFPPLRAPVSKSTLDDSSTSATASSVSMAPDIILSSTDHSTVHDLTSAIAHESIHSRELQ